MRERERREREREREKDRKKERKRVRERVRKDSVSKTYHNFHHSFQSEKIIIVYSISRFYTFYKFNIILTDHTLTRFVLRQIYYIKKKVAVN